MDIVQAIIIGIIEGFTEFLPISSTGHIIIATKFLGLPQDEALKAYEVIIQFAAILAVLLIYKEKITLKKMDLWIKLLLAFLPLAIVGFLLKDYIKALFSVEIVAWMFIIGGIVFLLVEYFYKEHSTYIKEVEKTTYTQALWIGFAQLFSLIPGTSRAGATIIGGMLVGLDRKTSSDFSFLLAIPVMGAVSGYDLLKHYDVFVGVNWYAFFIGFLVAFLVAYITVKLFLHVIQKISFVSFGIYRIIFGILLLVWL